MKELVKSYFVLRDNTKEEKRDRVVQVGEEVEETGEVKEVTTKEVKTLGREIQTKKTIQKGEIGKEEMKLMCRSRSGSGGIQ